MAPPENGLEGSTADGNAPVLCSRHQSVGERLPAPGGPVTPRTTVRPRNGPPGTERSHRIEGIRCAIRGHGTQRPPISADGLGEERIAHMSSGPIVTRRPGL